MLTESDISLILRTRVYKLSESDFFFSKYPIPSSYKGWVDGFLVARCKIGVTKNPILYAYKEWPEGQTGPPGPFQTLIKKRVEKTLEIP